MNQFSLTAYVPRLVARWLIDEPEARHEQVTGTLVSADISGFTKLAEKLAADGKVGGENLTFALNEVFTLLIDEAVALGGDVLKFGGDAVLILFTGHDHELRAVAASALMQRAIESERALAATSGIALRMSVGAHRGPIDLFLVGDIHRELVVAGPGATATARLEDSALAGEILIGAECAAALPKEVLVEERGGDRELAERDGVVVDRDAAAGLDVSRTVDLPVRNDSALAALLAPSLYNELEAIERTGGEHRRATIGFVRFQGIDERISAGAVDDVIADLDALVSLATELSTRYASTLLYSDIYFDGGKLLFAAGAPTSSGHDEASMLRTVLPLLELESGLELRAGVNAGPIFSGFLGAPTRRTFTVMGDAVNLAARLMQHADPSTLLATDELMGAAGTGFAHRSVEPFSVKGKAAPIRAGTVTIAADSDRAAEQEVGLGENDVEFVGRDDEIGQLIELRDRAVAGQGGIVVVSGPSGSGKSRLAGELLARSDVSTLRVSCEPYDELEAYAIARVLLRTLIGIDAGAEPARAGEMLAAHIAEVAPRLTPWVPLLAVVVGASVPPTPQVDALDTAFRRDRLHHAVLDYLDAALPDAAILVIEDSHWMDDATVALVTWMASLALADRPWLVALTTRTDAAEIDIQGRTISLPPMSAESMRALAHARLGNAAVAESAVDAMVARSGGNPLFLLALASNALDPMTDGADAEALPESVETLLTTRIDQLPPSLRLQLRRAAVAGVEFSDELLRAAGVTEIVPWGPASEFVQLARGGSYRFRQALFRDVAYEGLPYRHRREVHGSLADHLTSDDIDDEDQLGLISLHYHLAERHAEALDWSVRAGETAAAKFANEAAAELYRRALDNVRALSAAAGGATAELRARELAILESLGAVLELAGETGDAIEAFATAEELVVDGDIVRRGDLRRRRGVLISRTGDDVTAMSMFDDILAGVVGSDDESAIQLMARTLLDCSRIRHQQTRHVDAIEFAERAASAATRIDDKDTLARASLVMHLCNVFLHRAEAAEHRDVALPIFEANDDLVGQGNMLNNLGIESYFAGRWDEAAEYYERSRVARERCGDVVGAATAANNLAEILSDQGHFADAQTLFEQAREDWSDSGFALGVAVADSNRGRLAGRSGRGLDADTILAGAIGRFHELEAGEMAIEAVVRRAEAAALDRRWDDAERYAAEALAADHAPLVDAIAQRTLALVSAGRGDFGHANQLIRESSSIAASEGLEFERIVSELVHAELGGRAPSGDVERWVRSLGLISTPEVQLVRGLRASIAMGAVEQSEPQTPIGDDDPRFRALAGSDVLSAVDPATIRELADRASMKTFAAGSAVMRQGDRSDTLHLVTRGRFDISVSSDDGRPAVVDSVGRGAWIGESALLSDDRRDATVVARRDGEVVEISPTAMLAVVGSHPDVLRNISTRLVQRQRARRSEASSGEANPTVGILALHDADRVRRAADVLVDALRTARPGIAVADASTVTSESLRALEAEHDDLVIVSTGGDEDAIVRLLSVVDRLVLVGDDEIGPRLTEVDHAIAVRRPASLDVVIVGDRDGTEPVPWLSERRARRAHRLPVGGAASATDLRAAGERCVRFVLDAPTVAVLGGGGARGLAHLGVARAWRDADVAVDVIVASGSGAIAAAAVATGMPDSEAAAACADILRHGRRRWDVTLRRLALTSGASFTSRIRERFGDVDMSTLAIELHLVATDLASGEPYVVSDGELWRAVRASAAVPGVVPPMRRGDRALVDGGLSDPFPIELARAMFPRATIIGSDVTAPAGFADVGSLGPDGVTSRGRLLPRWSRFSRAPSLSLIGTLHRVATNHRRSPDGGDIVVRPPVEGFDVLDVDRAAELVSLGSETARRAIHAWRHRITS